MLAQSAWLPVLRTLGTRPWFGSRLQLSGTGDIFDADGRLVNESIHDLPHDFVTGFFAFAAGDRTL